MIKSLGNKLPGDKIQEADPYANKHRYRSVSRYGYSFI